MITLFLWLLALSVFLRLIGILLPLIPKAQAEKIMFHSFLLAVSAIIALVFFTVGSLSSLYIIGIDVSLTFFLLSLMVMFFVYVAILQLLRTIKKETAKSIFLVFTAIALAIIEASLLIIIEPLLILILKTFFFITVDTAPIITLLENPLFSVLQFIIVFVIAYKSQEIYFGVSGTQMIRDWWGELTQSQRDLITAYLFMIPSFTSLILFVFFPVFFSAIMSFFQNPTALQLRFAVEYYTNLANISMASLRKFFVANVEGTKGILMNEGIYAIFSILILVTYIYFGYKVSIKVLSRYFESNPLTSASGYLRRPAIAGFVVVTGVIVTSVVLTLSAFFFNDITFISVLIQEPIEEYRVVLTSIELDFVRVLFNTVFWTLACTFLHILLGMFLAILMNRDFVGKGFFRSIFILPWAIPSFVSTLVWRAFIFDRNQGLLGRLTANVPSNTGFSFSILDLLTIIAVIGLVILFIMFVRQYRDLIIENRFTFILTAILGLVIFSLVSAIILATVIHGALGIISNILTPLFPLFGIITAIVSNGFIYLGTIVGCFVLIILFFIYIIRQREGDALTRSMASLGLAITLISLSIILAILLSWVLYTLWTTTQIENLVPLLGIKIVDIPNISSTFWYTDDLYFLGFRFKMITWSAILVNVWLGVPFMMISFLAALQSIPVDLYEAAEIDGATGWQQFRKITLPLLKPTLMTVSLLGIIWTFNLFNVVYLLSQNQTGLAPAFLYDIFVTFIYDRFTNQEFSRASALSFIVFIMLISFSFVYRRILRAEAIFEGEAAEEKVKQSNSGKGELA
ncbi:MAG: ABC transporter permease subunit [Promethearchaeota archaeon]